MYSSKLANAKLVGCMAHIRRNFFETTPKNTDKNSFSRRGLNYCSKMFEVKESWTNLSHGERFIKLQEELASLM
ncbi:hypothetical protein ER616_09805 [Streptococcus pyogenes]|nr:hypothetical protein ER616_09805 [Streptococcus pyogenes]